MRSFRLRQPASRPLISGLFLASLAFPGAVLRGQSAAPAGHAVIKAVQAAAGQLRAPQAARPPGTATPASAGPKARAADPSHLVSATAAAPAFASNSGLRDPFHAPELPELSGAHAKLRASGPRPPGVRGLLVGQLRLQGVVREEASHSMIAMVTNATNLSYFVHENERLYDGVVSRIAPNAVYIRQDAPDAGGGAKSREVVLRMGPAAGDSQ